MKITVLPCLVCTVAASPTLVARQYGSAIWKEVWSLVQPYIQGVDLSISGPFAPITPEILKDYIEPVNVSIPVSIVMTDADVSRNNCFGTLM